MALYKIKSGEGLQPIPQKDFGVENYEERLEDLLEKTPQIPEGEDILFIGRQVNSEYGILDLLALNIDGDAIIIELKKGTTPREVIAQALGYAAWVNQLNYDQLNEIARKYYLTKGKKLVDLISIFKERFGIEEEIKAGEVDSLPLEFNRKQRIYIIAQDISGEVVSVTKFLRKRGVDITCIKFTYHTADSGEEIFETEWLVGKEETGEIKKEVPKGPGEYDEFFHLFEDEIKKILSLEIQPSYFSQRSRVNYKQIRYPGFGPLHYELRFVKEKVPQPSLEIALHKESSEYDGFLDQFFEQNKKVFAERLKNGWKAERWGKKWERIYKLIPLKRDRELNIGLARKAAFEMKNFIEVTQPLLFKK